MKGHPSETDRIVSSAVSTGQGRVGVSSRGWCWQNRFITLYIYFNGSVGQHRVYGKDFHVRVSES